MKKTDLTIWIIILAFLFIVYTRAHDGHPQFDEDHVDKYYP